MLALPHELFKPGPATVEVALAQKVDREMGEIEEEVSGTTELLLEEMSGRGRVRKVYKEGRELLVRRVRLEEVHELLASTDNLEPIVHQVNRGQIAVAKCDEDSSWGRVRVEKD